MATAVVSGERRARAVARPNPPWRLLRKVLCGLFALFLAVLAVALPPLGSLPAAAAPPALGITLTQSSVTSAIGAPLTLTATVSWSGGESPVPPNGWHVEFSGTGDGGWTSGPVPTDDGEASYTRSSPVAQSETLTARIANAGCTGLTSDAMTHEWWVPTIDLTARDSRTPIDDPVTLGAVLRNATTVANAELRLRVLDFETGAIKYSDVQTTGPDGNVEFSWESTVPEGQEFQVDELDFVRVDELGGSGASTVTTHAFVAEHSAGDRLDLTPTGPVAVRVGDDIVPAATLDVGGVRDTTPDIKFLTGDNGWVDPVATGGDGTATYRYFTSTPIRSGAVARSTSTGLAATFSIEFWRPTLTLVTPGATSIAGQPHTATATLTHDGIPISGAPLRFTIQGSGDVDTGTHQCRWPGQRIVHRVGGRDQDDHRDRVRRASRCADRTG